MSGFVLAILRFFGPVHFDPNATAYCWPMGICTGGAPRRRSEQRTSHFQPMWRWFSEGQGSGPGTVKSPNYMTVTGAGFEGTTVFFRTILRVFPDTPETSPALQAKVKLRLLLARLSKVLAEGR